MYRTHIFTVDLPKTFFERVGIPAWKQGLYMPSICANVVDRTREALTDLHQIKSSKITAHESDTLFIFRCSIRTSMSEQCVKDLLFSLVKKCLVNELMNIDQE